MANLPRRSPLRKLPALLLVLALLAPAWSTAAQTSETPEGAILPIAITVTITDVLDLGRSWVDGDGVHARGVTSLATVEGDLAGTAELVTELDQYGPCDALLECAGGQETFSEVRITGAEMIWDGTLALELLADGRAAVHGILVGRHGASAQVVVLDALAGAEGDTLELAGQMVTLSGPVEGVHLTGSACVTGPTTADGGFIGTKGLILDSGPLRVQRQTLGGAHPTGVYGEVRQIGQKGNLRGIFVAGVEAGYAHGSFVLVGESGPYRGVLGYGRATATIAAEARCASGLQVTSTWTGQVRYVTDPAAFLAPRVYFITPADGESVASPVTLEFGAENVLIEPAGMAREGAGHFTLIIDAPCVGPGEPMPDEEPYFQAVDGASSGALTAFSGEHRLCLQLTDGNGIAQPATDVITIFVAASGSDDLGGN